MSHIVKNKDDLMLLKDIFDEFRKETVDICLLEDTVKCLLPKDSNGELFSEYQIKEVDGGYSRFCLGDNCLKLSLDEMDRWSDFNSKKLASMFNINEIDLFRKYIFFSIIIHEIEHSYQYLMANGLIDSPCTLVSNGYKLIIDTLLDNNNSGILKEIKNIISYRLYNKNSGRYVIERNANVEAFDLLQKLAIENNHMELADAFNKIRNSIAIWGYIDNNKGSFYETCKDMKLIHEYKNFNHDYQLSDIERFRYGLPVSSEFRDKIKIIRK